MNKEPIFKVGDKVKIKLDKVIDEFKKYDGVYAIIGVEQFGDNDKFYYKLDGVPGYGTDDTIEKMEDKYKEILDENYNSIINCFEEILDKNFLLSKENKELQQKNKKYKEVINKVAKFVKENFGCADNGNDMFYYLYPKEFYELLHILKEVKHD